MKDWRVQTVDWRSSGQFTVSAAFELLFLMSKGQRLKRKYMIYLRCSCMFDCSYCVFFVIICAVCVWNWTLEHIKFREKILCFMIISIKMNKFNTILMLILIKESSFVRGAFKEHMDTFVISINTAVSNQLQAQTFFYFVCITFYKVTSNWFDCIDLILRVTG